MFALWMLDCGYTEFMMNFRALAHGPVCVEKSAQSHTKTRPLETELGTQLARLKPISSHISRHPIRDPKKHALAYHKLKIHFRLSFRKK
jgi:hypothetical protein